MGNNPFLRDVENDFDNVKEFVSGAYTTPAPTISSGPPAYSPPAKWYPPSRDYDDGSISSHYMVDTNVLHTVADTIQAEVPAAHQEISRLRSLATSNALARATGGESPSSLYGSSGIVTTYTGNWATGNDFGARMQSAAEGFATATEQIADIHIASVRKLAETAGKYAEAENKNLRLAQRFGEGGNLAIENVSHPKTDRVPLVAREIDIRTGALASTDYGNVDPAGTMEWLHAIQPGAYNDFEDCLRSLSTTLTRLANQIVESVKKMADGWYGTSAIKAFRAFQVMHTQTATLAAQAAQASGLAHWLGQDVLPQYKAIPNPRIQGAGDGPGASSSRGAILADSAEIQYLKALDNHLSQAYAAIPSPLVGTPASSGPGSAAGHASGPPAHTPARNPFDAYLQ